MNTSVTEAPPDAATAPVGDVRWGDLFAEPALLRLPPPDAPLTAGDDCADPSCAEHADPTRPPHPPRRWPEIDRDGAIGWYRWIVGHHVAVCAWRLVIERLTAVLDGEPGAGAAVAELFDAYSALLLYSGSCSPETYAAVIRARMKARHPAFSGTWARDHERVTALLTALRPHADGRLKQALKFNGSVHLAVGRRLVPAGKSLLRESGGHAGDVTEADRDRFDEFFLIDRAPVCPVGFAGQTAQRVDLALADLAARPADVDYGDDRVNALQADLPARLERLRDLSRPALRRDTP